MIRHKWIRNALPVTCESDMIPGVYQIDICQACGCTMLHKYFGGTNYAKTYLLDGKEIDIRPDCKIKTIKNESSVG